MGLQDGNALTMMMMMMMNQCAKAATLQSDFKSLGMKYFEDLRTIMNEEAPCLLLEVQRT
jgi:hypothetical protein